MERWLDTQDSASSASAMENLFDPANTICRNPERRSRPGWISLVAGRLRRSGVGFLMEMAGYFESA